MTSIRSLDPVDPSAPPPDGGRVLAAVLAAPGPATRTRTGARLLALVPVALVLALVIGVVAVLVAAGDRGNDEREATGGTTGGAILHYVVRERVAGADGSLQAASTEERWQRTDGSRARIVTHWDGAGPLHGTAWEDVLTNSESVAYRPAAGGQPARIIRYRATDDFAAIPEDPPPFGAPAIGGSSAVGDPRTVPDRLAAGDKDVTQLPDATVRGVAVKQFQVGDCRGSTGSERAIVALARDTSAPVRVTHEPCGSGDAAPVETRVLDYLSFEELAPTPQNLMLLDFSPRPGVPVVDGIDIDKAEEHDDAGPAPTPTPARSAP